MYTIYDYIKYYKDKTIDEVKWNIMDNLICALLVYSPIQDSVKCSNLNELMSSFSNIKKDKNLLGVTALKTMEIIDLIANCKRYKNLIIKDFIKVKSNDTQFGALTIKLNNIKVISFKGTDRSLIGWLENFRLAYEYPTITQKLALEYLNNNTNINDNDVYVVGHSKGGNLAMYGVMELDDEKFNRIKSVINFDGPGFRKKEFNSSKYKKMQPKLINIIPTGSLIGILMYNENYTVVISKEKGYQQHFPTTWNIFGEYFVEGELSSISKQLHERSTEELEKLDIEMLKETTETLFKTIGKEYSNNIKISFKDVETIYHNMGNIDPKIKEYIDTIFNSLVMISYNKKNFISKERKDGDKL